MEKPKYVTRKKRIRQLEKRVSELEQQVETLTHLLDSVCQMVYAKRPRLARSMAREFRRYQKTTDVVSTAVVQVKPRRKLRNPSIAPRADFKSNGH